MTNLTDKFDGTNELMTSIGDEAHSQRESAIGSLEDIKTALANMDADIIALKQLMLRGIGQSDPCATCPPPSLITPITSPTTHTINADWCKRTQALNNAVHQITGVLGAISNSAIVWSPSVVYSGLTEVITSLVEGDTVPLPSFGEAASIAGGLIDYGLSNIGRGDDLQAQFDTLIPALQTAMYSTNSPTAAQAAYMGIIDGSDLPGDEKSLFKSLGFNDLFSYFFDPESTPDLTPYDGGICELAPGACYHIVADISVYGHTTTNWPGSSPALPTAGSGDLSFATPMGTISGYIITNITPSGVGTNYWINEPGGGHSTAAFVDGFTVFTHDDTYSIEIFSPSNTPFTFDLCPPEEM